MKRSDVKPRAEVLAEVAQWLDKQHGIKMLGGLGFENAYALAMARQSRRANSACSTIGDLAPPRAATLDRRRLRVLRPAGVEGVARAYGLTFRAQRQMQPEFMYPAVAAGEVDVISAYTSDGRIAQFGLQVLADDKQAIPPYDAILLVSPKRANDEALIQALKPLVGAVSIDTMREANRRVSTGRIAVGGQCRAMDLGAD